MSRVQKPGPAPSLLRRHLVIGSVLGGTSLVLSACGTTMPGLSGFGGSSGQAPAGPTPLPDAQGPKGNLRVGLILPLSAGGNVGAAAASLKNAAELAVSEFNGSEVALLIKDDRGTPDGAAQAAQEVIAEGAQIILGPLLAPTVQAVGQVARQAGKPVIAFSTDASVATRGVYLLSFMPESEVDRVIEFAASRGKRSVAAMIPDSAYGNVVASAFQESAARRGVRVALIERYAGPTVDAGAKRIAQLGAQADALLLPVNAEGIGGATAALANNKVKLQMLGTAAWEDPRVLQNLGIQGGWFAAPDKAGYANFAGRYRAKYGSDPVRVGTLAYDAVFLVNALYVKYGAQAFSDAILTNSEGIIGTDGLFRFRPDGTNQRGLAVLQVNNGTATVVSAAPRAFAPGS